VHFVQVSTGVGYFSYNQTLLKQHILLLVHAVYLKLCKARKQHNYNVYKLQTQNVCVLRCWQLTDLNVL